MTSSTPRHVFILHNIYIAIAFTIGFLVLLLSMGQNND